MNVDIERKLKVAVSAAIDLYKMGEPTDYMVALCWTPNDQGNMRLCWNLVFVQRDPGRLGSKFVQIQIVPEPDPSPEEVDRIVKAACEELRSMRARSLALPKTNGDKR